MISKKSIREKKYIKNNISGNLSNNFKGQNDLYGGGKLPFIPRIKKSPKSIRIRTLALFLRKLFNSFFRSGKKEKIYRILFRVSFLIKLNTKLSILDFFYEVYKTAAPAVVLQYKSIGNSKQGIPILPNDRLKNFYAVKWIRDSIKENSSKKKLPDKLFDELFNVYKNSDNCLTLKKKNKLYFDVFNNKKSAYLLKMLNRKNQKGH